MAKQYNSYKRKADRLSKKLKKEQLQRTIKEFHDSVHVEEITKQLNSVKPSDVIALPAITYDLPERARAAALTRNVRHHPDSQIRRGARLKDRTVQPAVQVTPETEISLLFCPFCK